MIPSLLICCTYYANVITSIYIIQLMHNACFDYLSFNLYYFINCIFKNCPGEIWLYNLTMVQTDVNVKAILEVHHKPDMISREH